MPDRRTQSVRTDPIEILFVEDDGGFVRLVREAFETTSIETSIHTVRTGTAALDALRRRTDDDAVFPDLALLDLDLPEGSGFEVLETVREDAAFGALPILILTDSRDADDVARSYDSHANAYITKPSDFDGIVSLVETIEEFWLDKAELPSAP